MPAGPSPVNAIAARNDQHGHTKDVSLEVVLNAAIRVITPITEELGKCPISRSSLVPSDRQIGCIKAENATLEVIAPIVANLKVAIEGAIVDVKGLASVPLDRLLCTLVGGVLDALAIAKLLGCLLNVGAFISVWIGPIDPFYSSSSVLAVLFLLLSSSPSRPRSPPSLLRSAPSSVLSSAAFSVLSTASSSRSSHASSQRLPAASTSSRSWMSRPSFPSSVSNSNGEVKVSRS